MTFQPGQSGNPAGRPPSAETRFRREIDAAMRGMADSLLDVTRALVDRATGLRLFQVIDVAGLYGPPTDAQARQLLAEPGLADALLATGVARVYLREPDLAAARAVQDRVMGKVPTVVELHLRREVEQLRADHATLVRVIREHVPDDYLQPLLAELERIEGRAGAADREPVGVAGP